MTEKRQAIEFDSTAATVARNLVRLRASRGLTTRGMSAALMKLGRSISADAICKIENVARPDAEHKRRVDVDDLVALAIVLGVSPSALLLPLTDTPTVDVDVTGIGSIPSDLAWDWMDGKRPCRPISSADPTGERIDYLLHSRPPVRRNAEFGHG